jgi:deoxycytidylate deaminase
MLVAGDPTFIENKEGYFIDIAKAISKGSTHPLAPGGCVIVRGREIIGDGRSILATCKVEVDCITYAIAAAARNGISTNGAEVYSTRYPFSASIFQLHLMGIRKIVVLQHEWEPYYREEFRRAARLARELSISIEPHLDNADPRFSTNTAAPVYEEGPKRRKKADEGLYTSNPIEADDYDIETIANQTNDSDSPF